MMAAAVGGNQGFTAAAPRALFDAELSPKSGAAQYQVTADGQRFLLLVPESRTPPLRVIINWRERFKAEALPQ